MNEQKRRLIQETGHYFSVPRGVSMNPMLYNLDSVVDIVPFEGILKKNDVALYENERIKKNVMHRIVDVGETYYVFRGDNCLNEEIVPFSDVIGVAAQFKRRAKDRWISVTDPAYLRYVSFWNAIWPLRKVFYRFRALIHAIYRKLRRK